LLEVCTKRSEKSTNHREQKNQRKHRNKEKKMDPLVKPENDGRMGWVSLSSLSTNHREQRNQRKHRNKEKKMDPLVKPENDGRMGWDGACDRVRARITGSRGIKGNIGIRRRRWIPWSSQRMTGGWDGS
jgi:hypothetical protein